jgi:hypothetical protein
MRGDISTSSWRGAQLGRKYFFTNLPLPLQYYPPTTSWSSVTFSTNILYSFIVSVTRTSYFMPYPSQPRNKW